MKANIKPSHNLEAYSTRWLICIAALFFGVECAVTFSNTYAWSQESTPPTTDEAIRIAFEKASDGWSVDELLLQDELRANFMHQCALQETLLQKKFSDKQLFERLVQIRKAGKLPLKSTQRSRADLEAWHPIAEIASRQMVDKYNLNVDQWLVDPDALKRFDQLALEIDANADGYAVRKAALQLRKSRRLQPELLARVVDWKRTIQSMSVSQAEAALLSLPTNPGVYIFRDESGYLYIGQSNNLKTRLTKHLDRSDRKSLSSYLKSKQGDEITLELHIFEEGSPAIQTVVREAYESELIRTRKPRLNVAP
ncbi:MAG: GIY-YIG nuclease family protein [Pirellula sp.]